jgi:lipopolysaccharide/colanic/teichoic acid biosynthesis glycosyltransferase
MSPLSDIRAFAALLRLFRRERFTIVHTHQVKSAVFAQLAARLCGVPIVVNTIHGFYFHDNTPPAKRRAWIALERLVARMSSAILSQNREDIDTAVRERICRPDQIRHIGNGIDVRRFDRAAVRPGDIDALRRELRIEEGEPVVGFVGRLVREKGVLELFDAVRILRERFPRLRLLVIGPVDAVKADAIGTATAGDFGIDGCTIFTGYRHDMPQLYTLMDVCVLPSHREGMPRSPMEASAMGVPCVATAIRGCREVVQHGDNGLLVPVGDAQALAQAVTSILEDRGVAARMSSRGREIAVAQFDERIVFERVRLAYVDLLRTRVRQPMRKRAFDLIVGTILLVAALPLMAVVAIIVRLSLGSPVLFRQSRPGLGGHPFTLLKFRTMRDVRAADGSMLPDGARLTTVGRLLRRTSLDELPELLNVVRGDMSLVGPRPLLMQYLQRYTPHQARRHEMPPGITGLAQISGRNNLSWEERFDLDVQYVDQWSLWVDIRILMCTLLKVFVGEGISQPGHDTAAEFMGTPPKPSPPHGV